MNATAARQLIEHRPADRPALRLVPVAAADAGGDVDQLIREHEPLVQKIAARVIAPWIGLADRGDVLQEGRIGLWRAARLFDPARGVRFGTYAWKAIERCMRASLARRSRAMAGFVTRDRHESTVADRAPPKPPFTESPEAFATARQVDRLTGRAREVMVRRLGLDGIPAESLEQIGERWGVSAERVRQVQHATIVLLRRKLGVCAEGENPPPAVTRRRRRSSNAKRKVRHDTRR